ncbi:MAG: serine hydrolase [Epsilonproteobacteria bacterium]|nr:serine hydrolase [Campylobacterota bacterium]
MVKVLTSLVIALLAQEGKINVNKTIGFYMPDFKGTVWQDIPIIDVLDMATGTDFVENDETRSDPNSAATRIFQAIMGVKSASGILEHHTDVLKSAKKIGPSGYAFEYGSGVTQMLVLLAEEIEQKRWADIFEERVWSKMGVESDLQVPLTPDGIAAVQGTVSSRLRDLGRFGMLYTPSWNKASHEQIVSKKMLSDIQNGCRPEIFNKGHMGAAMTKHFKEKPKCNACQWDAIFNDGDIYKSGLMGQGLYVSPSRDLVIVWFSADKAVSITGYSRAIATSGLFK